MIDQNIIQGVKKGEKNAFKDMYEDCVPYVYSVVSRYVSNPSDYKDVIQEIFARLFLSIDTFDEKRGAFKPWLRRLTINQCMMHYRKHKHEAQVIQLEYAKDLESSYESRINELSKEEIKSLLQDMPDGYRQIFMMIIIDEYSHKEVADLLEISVDTSRSQLSRAKGWIRKKLFNNTNKILANGF